MRQSTLQLRIKLAPAELSSFLNECIRVTYNIICFRAFHSVAYQKLHCIHVYMDGVMGSPSSIHILMRMCLAVTIVRLEKIVHILMGEHRGL